MNLNEEFLKLYRQVEMYIDGKYPYTDSSVYEHIKKLEKSMVKKDIEKAAIYDALRSMRNQLSHRNVGEYIEVTQKSIDFLKSEIDEFINPKSAKDIMLPIDKVYYVYLSDNTIDVLDEIYKNGYDVLPVVNELDQVIGIFSLDVILKSIYSKKVGSISKESTLKEFKELIGIDDQIKERYAFVSDEATVEEIISIFNKKEPKKLKMLFVTKYGNSKNPIIGIITPHDVINHK
ncbi:MAG: CBS domain-containing protein [Erysipelotrichaceae bacterium]|nr:CBS domain-containing protein [Erysipelotrichaceae bacterium]